MLRLRASPPPPIPLPLHPHPTPLQLLSFAIRLSWVAGPGRVVVVSKLVPKLQTSFRERLMWDQNKMNAIPTFETEFLSCLVQPFISNIHLQRPSKSRPVLEVPLLGFLSSLRDTAIASSVERNSLQLLLSVKGITSLCESIHNIFGWRTSFLHLFLIILNSERSSIAIPGRVGRIVANVAISDRPQHPESRHTMSSFCDLHIQHPWFNF